MYVLVSLTLEAVPLNTLTRWLEWVFRGVGVAIL